MRMGILNGTFANIYTYNFGKITYMIKTIDFFNIYATMKP